MAGLGFLKKILPSKKLSVAEMEREAEKERKLRAAEEGVKYIAQGPEPDEEGKVNGEYEIIEREFLPERIKCPVCGGTTWEGLEVCDKCKSVIKS